MLYGMIGVTFVYNSALRKFDFRGRWFVSPKNGGRSKKAQGQTDLKNEGSSLAVGTYLRRGSAPPPLGVYTTLFYDKDEMAIHNMYLPTTSLSEHNLPPSPTAVHRPKLCSESDSRHCPNRYCIVLFLY